MNSFGRSLRLAVRYLPPAALILAFAVGCAGSVAGTADESATVGSRDGDRDGNPTGKDGGSDPDFSMTWGGEHIQLQIADSVALLEYDCAHGRMTSLPTPRADGTFITTGTHVFLHGGPIREGEPEDAHPAEYRGSVSGDVMTLRVRLLDTRAELGPFTLRRAHVGALFCCL